ncbi:hypothetical protein HELRODRAFT_178698 [Helobdella robusta]|uniref:Uncharacterized protein n=1 Tax=Helobdella robusta TaxID=6412 RepID=T1FDL1_HELRO|nr:hypothetical protein HELRODRAFT_178698 [Helobdella robusta]ESN96899.1 hypothetical protein HELRODRAFT_178698 [Helobdella robusta]
MAMAKMRVGAGRVKGGRGRICMRSMESVQVLSPHCAFVCEGVWLYVPVFKRVCILQSNLLKCWRSAIEMLEECNRNVGGVQLKCWRSAIEMLEECNRNQKIKHHFNLLLIGLVSSYMANDADVQRYFEIGSPCLASDTSSHLENNSIPPDPEVANQNPPIVAVTIFIVGEVQPLRPLRSEASASSVLSTEAFLKF